MAKIYYHIIVTLKIDSVQVTSVHKAGLTMYCVRACDSGLRKVSAVLIAWCLYKAG